MARFLGPDLTLVARRGGSEIELRLAEDDVRLLRARLFANAGERQGRVLVEQINSQAARRHPWYSLQEAGFVSHKGWVYYA